MQGADRMTVERVTRFYLGEFQTTLQKGGKYINQLDPEEEKALLRRACCIHGTSFTVHVWQTRKHV